MKGKIVIYISGAITNNPDYIAQFKSAERILKGHGIKVVNPIKHEKKNKSWIYYMRKDIKKLMKCDTILMLNGYENSKGAMLELYIAEQLKFTIVYEDEIFRG